MLYKAIDALAGGAAPSPQLVLPLLQTNHPTVLAYLQQKAVALQQAQFGNGVYLRGLIEISSYCGNDCYYCGIRRSNQKAQRYRLTNAEILAACGEGYALGFRSFVLQGGEDGYFTTSRLVKIVAAIRAKYPDCAITLSLGEMEKPAYQALFDAGANRYLLRHEAASPALYAQLHPPALHHARRLGCLQALQEIGFQVGCGMMVGAPHQRLEDLVEDLQLLYSLRPQMVGIGPFIPHDDTPFAAYPPGGVDLTCRLLALVRLLLPQALLPATTALGSVQQGGREAGILWGANVVMPNLSPPAVRQKYLLYNGKLHSGDEAAEGLARLEQQLQAIGYTGVHIRGDHPDFIK